MALVQSLKCQVDPEAMCRAFLQAGHTKEYEEALAEVRKEHALAPDSVGPSVLLGDILMILKGFADAKPFYEKALMLATTVEPEFAAGRIPGLESKLRQVRGSATSLPPSP